MSNNSLQFRLNYQSLITQEYKCGWRGCSSGKHLTYYRSKKRDDGISPVVQWLRMCLPTQGTWVCFLVRECDPTSQGLLSLCAPGPVSHIRRSPICHTEEPAQPQIINDLKKEILDKLTSLDHWSFNKTGLNCMDLLIHGFFFFFFGKHILWYYTIPGWLVP